MKINCIIIDDEPLARKGLAEFVAEIDFLELKGLGENALAANNLLSQHTIDLIFLDIQMPKMTGIELLKALKQKPMIIFTTAYSEYALQGYELDVLDYLVKPISFERFLKACNKAKEFYAFKNTNPDSNPKTADYFFVKCDNGYEKIMYDDLLYIEAMENYVKVHTPIKKLVIYLTFKSLADSMPASKFIKVHKSFMVAIEKVTAINGNELKIGKDSIPISRTMKDEVMEVLIKNKLLKR
jgi:DNA-binding LytR/AlgR family response regulator